MVSSSVKHSVLRMGIDEDLDLDHVAIRVDSRQNGHGLEGALARSSLCLKPNRDKNLAKDRMDDFLADASWEDLDLDSKCVLVQFILVGTNIGAYGGQRDVIKNVGKIACLRDSGRKGSMSIERRNACSMVKGLSMCHEIIQAFVGGDCAPCL